MAQTGRGLAGGGAISAPGHAAGAGAQPSPLRYSLIAEINRP